MEKDLEKEKQNTKVGDEPLFIEKDHKGLKWFIIITLILLILGGIGTFYYFKIYSNPMLVIGNIFKDAKEKLNFQETNEIETFKFSGELDFDLGFEDDSLKNIADIINNVKLQYILSNDGDDYTALELFTKYKDNKLLNAKIILETKENLGYLYLEDLYDKYLYFDLEETSDTIETDIDYEIITINFVEALINAFNEDDFERCEDKTSINGSIKKVYRNSIIINRGNYQRIMKTFITKLRNNDDFINEINKINKNIDIKEEFNTILEEIDKEIFEDVIKINFYTKRSLKQELLKLEIVQSNKDDDTTISITENSEDKVTIDMYDSNNNKMTMDIKLNGDTNFIINANFENGDDYIKVHLNCSLQELDKINKIDTKPSIDIDKLTENDFNKIMDNLAKNEALLNLISDFSNIFALSM